MFKRIIGFVLAAVLMLSSVSAVVAADKITADNIIYFNDFDSGVALLVGNTNTYAKKALGQKRSRAFLTKQFQMCLFP